MTRKDGHAVNVLVDGETYKAFCAEARKQGLSQAALARNLIGRGLREKRTRPLNAHYRRLRQLAWMIQALAEIRRDLEVEGKKKGQPYVKGRTK